MKLLKKTNAKDSSGDAVLIAEDKEDLWAIYNLCQAGDLLTMLTMRKLKVGSKNQVEKKTIKLTIEIEKVEYLPTDESMRIRGKTVEEHEDVPLSSYHTMVVEYNKQFKIHKSVWDEVANDIIVKSCSIEEKAELGAVIMQEGVAHICLITDNMTVLRLKLERSIPKKRRGDNSAHDKAMGKFYEEVTSAVIRHFDLGKLKAILLASPGFVAQGLYDAIFVQATKDGNKAVIQAKSKFLVAHASTGYLQGLEEVLQDESVVKQLSQTKFAKEVTLLEDFFKALNDDDGRAWYGPKECEKAAEIGAIKTLLITDSVFRNDDINLRKHYITLTNNIKYQGGEVVLFSTLHESGSQLDDLTGIAALLKYPIPDLDEDLEN